MNWLAGSAYITAATLFPIQGHTPMLSFIAATLLVWLAIAALVESRAVVPATPVPTDGWTIPPSHSALQAMDGIRQVAFTAALMRTALILFSFLLLSWALLP